MGVLANTIGEKIEADDQKHLWRNSRQPLLPGYADPLRNQNTYNAEPFCSLGDGKIFSGFDGLAEWIAEQKTVLIDGYGGVFYGELQKQIEQEFQKKGISSKWYLTEEYFKAEEEIDQMVQPFLGAEGDVWGSKSDLELRDFLDIDKLSNLKRDEGADVVLVAGPGAGLLDWDAPVIYFDLPKNEIQYRMRAGAISNLGKRSAETAFAMYKRFYFVDWVALNKHKSALRNRIAIVADGQRPDQVNWMFQNDLVKGLNLLSHTVLRARPWFESGSWGGQWMKKHLEGLNTEEVNYAWSFELITPENGVVLESNGNLLEISFDFLMLFEYQAIVGKHADLFGTDFPIRFDFLDTFSGGNLSIQCHPSRNYIREKFGEEITQDETYYILDCEPGAKVYLGFQEDIDPKEFREVLENSQLNNEKIAVEKYVQSFPSHKHDLFLIPNGTVHSSGVNNMVLEISATPYIFTFKMYDWLSLDLQGKPRPINIEHAFNNLRFERKGERVIEELISKPLVLSKGKDWELVHLPTHEQHFYDVHRIEFDGEIEVETQDSCHVLMLVEGSSISIEIEGNKISTFHYAETFVVPAAALKYKLINHAAQRAKVIKAFLKADINL